MGKLEYDDSAFAYFGLTFLMLFALPYSYYYFNTTFSKEVVATTNVDQLDFASLRQLIQDKKKHSAFVPRSHVEERKLKEALEQERPLDSILRRLSFKLVVKTLFLFLLWSGVFHMAKLCYNEETQISQFDPYEILDVPRSSTEQQVRKKYRKLSIEWHPDQWVLKPAEDQVKAEAMFIKISKAYSALTDETSRENYKKYGNPDGPQPMALSLGLPSFLLDPKNQNVVLLIYLVVLVVVVPTAVFLYYTNSKRFSEKLILNETYQVLAYMLNPNTTTKHLLDVISLSAEYRKTIPESTENDALFVKLKRCLMGNDLMPKKPLPQAAKLYQKWPGNEKVNILLQAHLHRAIPIFFPLSESEKQENVLMKASFTEDEVKYLRELLDEILKMSPMLLDAMQEVATMRRSLKLLHKVITFKACFIQAIYPSSPNGCLMIPDIDRDGSTIRKLSAKGITTVEKLKTAGFGSENFTGKVQGVVIPQDVSEMARPMLDSKTGVRWPEVILKIGCMEYEDKKTGRVFMDDKFGEKDIVTVYVVLNFSGKEYKEEDSDRTVGADGDPVVKDELNRNESALAFAPYVPIFFKESFSVSVGVKNSDEHLLGSVDMIADKLITRGKILFKPDFKKPGKYNFDIFVQSKNYVGYETQATVELTVIKQEDIVEEAVHPEDLESEKTPGLFDVFESADKEEDSDFEASDDEKAEAPKKVAAVSEKKSAPAEEKAAASEEKVSSK